MHIWHDAEHPHKKGGVAMMRNTGLAIAACLAISACATNYASKPASEVAKAVTVKDSQFDSSAAYIAPLTLSTTKRGLFTDNESVQLVAMQDKKSKQVTFRLAVRIMYSFDWRFYESASFNDGSRVDSINTKREVDACNSLGCIHTEELVFPIDKTRLADAGSLTFRLNSKAGAENIITIPKNYIDGFLLTVPM